MKSGFMQSSLLSCFLKIPPSIGFQMLWCPIEGNFEVKLNNWWSSLIFPTLPNSPHVQENHHPERELVFAQ